jgi:hypothetical protein
MHCLYCKKKIGLLQRMVDREYCSEGHRKAHRLQLSMRQEQDRASLVRFSYAGASAANGTAAAGDQHRAPHAGLMVHRLRLRDDEEGAPFEIAGYAETGCGPVPDLPFAAPGLPPCARLGSGRLAPRDIEAGSELADAQPGDPVEALREMLPGRRAPVLEMPRAGVRPPSPAEGRLRFEVAGPNPPAA